MGMAFGAKLNTRRYQVWPTFISTNLSSLSYGFEL
jgi:hypothetical protein